MTRYMKATDGIITVFRASTGRIYASASMPPNSVSFSAKSANRGMNFYPCEEITKAEYQALVARKNERLLSAGKDPARYNSPQDSWAFNHIQREG